MLYILLILTIFCNFNKSLYNLDQNLTLKKIHINIKFKTYINSLTSGTVERFKNA